MKKAWNEKFMQGVFFIAACASVLAVALICVFLFANGIPAMKEIGFLQFLSGERWRPVSYTHLDVYKRQGEHLSDVQWKASRAIMNCKSGSLGSSISQCTDCGHTELSLIHI